MISLILALTLDLALALVSASSFLGAESANEFLSTFSALSLLISASTLIFAFSECWTSVATVELAAAELAYPNKKSEDKATETTPTLNLRIP